MSDGGIDFKRLVGNPPLLFRRKILKRAHVVQAVSKLHQHHPHVVHHGQQHFAEVFRLLFLRAQEVNAADLGDALTMRATSGPNCCFKASMLAEVSSTTSCSMPAARHTVSRRKSARMFVTSRGCVM